MRAPASGLGLLLLVGAALTTPAAFAGNTDRILAIGDIHGSYDGLVSILRETGLTGSDGRWTGGRARLVQTGDFTDRGGGVRAVMDLLIDLEKQAAAAGGGVTVLLGNHELLNLMRHDADVAINPEIYASFVDEGSARRRGEALAEWEAWLRRRGEIDGLAPPETDTKEAWLRDHPLGFVEYHRALSPTGRYGRWLRRLPVVHRAGEIVFLHGGLSETFAALSLDRINQLHRDEIESIDQVIARLERKGVVPPSFTWTEIVAELRARLASPERRQRALLQDAAERLDRFLGVTNSADSPLWFRGYARPPLGLADDALEELRRVLDDAYGARYFVVAHSPLQGREIAVRLDSFFLIDTGMLASVYNGRPSALEFSGEEIAAIYPGQRQLLLGGAPADVDHAAVPSAASAARAEGLRKAPLFLPAAETTSPPSADEKVYTPPPRRWLGLDGEPLPFTSPEEVEKFLADARVVSSQPVGEGKTGADRLLLELDGVQAHCIFHDIDDRRDPTTSVGPVRLSRGSTMLRFRDSYSGQVAAYHLARLMGVDTVPPAVVRNIDGAKGSLALWIEGGTNLTKWREQNPRQPQHPYYQHQIWDMRVFDALANNKDRNTGNIFWTPDWNLWLIDHTRTFAQDPDLYRPDLVQRCSRDLLARIESLDEKQVLQTLRPYLSVFEAKAIFKRRKRLLRHLQDRIDKLGEDRVLFDYGDPTGVITIRASGAAV